jgi:hypothetical protein
MFLVPLTEVKVNVLVMYLLRIIAFGLIVLDDAKIVSHLIECQESFAVGKSCAYETVVPGMSTLVSNFSGHSQSYY